MSRREPYPSAYEIDRSVDFAPTEECYDHYRRETTNLFEYFIGFLNYMKDIINDNMPELIGGDGDKYWKILKKIHDIEFWFDDLNITICKKYLETNYDTIFGE